MFAFRSPALILLMTHSSMTAPTDLEVRPNDSGEEYFYAIHPNTGEREREQPHTRFLL